MIRVAASIPLALILFAACTDDGGSDDESTPIPECVEYELEGCAPLYPATYDQVWTQTFSDGCAEFGTACHAQDDAAGAVNGLTFVDPQVSFDHLTMTGQLVVPGDPLCSPLFVRLATDDPAIRMPPGSSGLDPGALCSIGTWISDGAQYVQP
jgi:hypothetical protein